MRILPALALFLTVSTNLVLGEEYRGPLNTHLPAWVTLGAQVRYRAESTTRDYLLER